MRLSLISVVAVIAGVIALPVAKMDIDSQAGVEGKLEIRETQVSSWFQVVSCGGEKIG